MEGVFQTGTFFNKKLKLLQNNLCVPLKGKLREFCHLAHSLTPNVFFFQSCKFLLRNIHRFTWNLYIPPKGQV
jgi:hypothetical protein